MPNRRVSLPLLAAALAVSACTISDSSSNNDALNADVDCEVAIVGGGPAGLYLAFRLTPTLGDKVCLFEKEAQLGGRIRDESTGDASGPWIGTGARRLQENQTNVFALATELGITFEKPELGTDLIEANGKVSYAKNDYAAFYPNMKVRADATSDQETYIYDLLQKGPERANANNYADFKAYVDAVGGRGAYDFLRDVSRFKADFKLPIAARYYLDYLDEEGLACCTPSYPIGGMSSFIRAMEAKTVAQKGRIFKSEPVTEISHAGKQYQLKTPGHVVSVNKLVVTAPPAGFDSVQGDVATAIKATNEYKALMPIPVVVINNVWETAWWENIKNPAVTTGEARTWRQWTTKHCVSFTEIPFEPYARAQKVTRSVYNDDPDCVAFWVDLQKKGIDAVEAEVVRGLTQVFNANNVSSPAMVTVPKPKSTTMQVWPGAWYYLRAGVKFTSSDMQAWMLAPLPNEPNLVVAGEAYWGSRPGWSDGAYKSMNKVLIEKFGIQPPPGQLKTTQRTMQLGEAAPAARHPFSQSGR